MLYERTALSRKPDELARLELADPAQQGRGAVQPWCSKILTSSTSLT